MQFAKVNYGLNQTYFVETEAFNAAVKNSIKGFKEYKIQDIEVVMNQAQSNVKIKLVLSTTKTSVKYSEDIPAIEKNINEGVSNLIDGKPINIKIQIHKGAK